MLVVYGDVHWFPQQWWWSLFMVIFIAPLVIVMIKMVLMIVVKPSRPIVRWSCPCLLLSGASPCTSSLRIVYLFQAVSSARIYFFSWPNFFYLFSEMYTRLLSMAWSILIAIFILFNINWICVLLSNFSCPRKVKFVWKWVLGNSASSDQGLT